MSPKNSQPLIAKINLKNLAYNLNRIKNTVSSQTKIMAVVKANAYGHGLLPTAKHLHSQGVKYFAVARLEEALTLRKTIKKAAILILSPIPPEFYTTAVKNNISLTISEVGELKKLAHTAANQKNRALIHLKIDTGLNRSGLESEDIPLFVKELVRHDQIHLEGVFTHLAAAGNDRRFTSKQLKTFTKAALPLKQRFSKVLLHAAASSAIFRYKQSHFDLVRPGMALYGIDPGNLKGRELKPILSLETKISRLHMVKKGETIGYDRTYKAPKNLLVATLMVGYADGLRRAPFSWPYVSIDGKFAPIVGRISMDQTMIDISKIHPRPHLYDKVVLLASRGPCSVKKIAAKIGTSPYEVLANLSPTRIERVYYS